MLQAETPQLVAPGESLANRGCNRLRALGVGANRDAAGRLVHRRMRRGDDRRTRGHRLGDRHPESLEPRRIDDGGGAAIEPRQLLVVDAPQAEDAGPVELGLLAPTAAPDDGERQARIVEQRERLDEGAEILAGLERGDREQVRPLAFGDRRRPR